MKTNVLIDLLVVSVRLILVRKHKCLFLFNYDSWLSIKYRAFDNSTFYDSQFLIFEICDF